VNEGDVTVRWATLQDAHAIAQVHVDSWKVAYAGLIDSERLASLGLPQRERQWRDRLAPAGGEASTLVAEMGGEIVGFCALALPARDADEPPDVAEIPALYVAPGRWGAGAGSALIEAALAAMRERGYREAVLWMLAGNERARRFYERHRFARDGGRRRSQYFPDAEYMVELRFRRPL